MQPLRETFGDQVEFVEADLLDEDSLMKAIEGSTYVVHTASPAPINMPKDENVLIKPAVNGTMAIMKAAHKNSVKRVVITSSVAAIAVTQDNDKNEYTVNDWSDITKADPYYKSKTLAERAAWDFQASLPESERFEIVTICPSLVLGPNLNKAQFTSGDVIKKIMMREIPGMPKISMGIVDVRDVAEAHLQGILKPEAANKRFILCAETVWFKEIGTWLHEVYAKEYKPIHKEVPKFAIWIVSFFNKTAKVALPRWGKKKTFINKETREILGIDFIAPKTSVLDMAASLISTGYIPNKLKS